MKWWILPLALMASGGVQAKSWTVKPDGVGAYKVGAHHDNLGKAFGGLGPATRYGDDKSCMIARSLRYPNVELTFVRKALARVDISGGFASDRGVGVGSPASKLQRAYGDAVQPHPQHADWLMVETGSRELAIRYIMRDGRVASIQAGKREKLNTLAGCQ